MALPGPRSGLTLATTWGFCYGVYCDQASLALPGPGSGVMRVGQLWFLIWLRLLLAQGLGPRWSTSCDFSSGFYCGTLVWAGLAHAFHMAFTVTQLLWPCLAQGLGSLWPTVGVSHMAATVTQFSGPAWPRPAWPRAPYDSPVPQLPWPCWAQGPAWPRVWAQAGPPPGLPHMASTVTRLLIWPRL